jgi:hypothetical protein
VLIEQTISAISTKLVERAFGFGAAKPRAIGVGLFRRLLSFMTLLETLQIDHVPHIVPAYPLAPMRGDRVKR